MNETTMARGGSLMAAILAMDAALHAYWAAGGVWPAHDSRAFMEAILNVNKPVRPLAVAPLACLLALGAAMAQARVGRLGWIGRLAPAWLLQTAVLTIAAGAFARAVAGIVWMSQSGVSPTFARLNLWFWTPSCILPCAAAILASRAGLPSARVQDPTGDRSPDDQPHPITTGA